MDHNDFSQITSLEVKTLKGFKVININHIVYIEAARKCSILYMDDQNSIITFHILKWYNNSLAEPFFFRNHNSYMINCRYVDSYCSKAITMFNKKKLPLARRRIITLKRSLYYVNEVYKK